MLLAVHVSLVVSHHFVLLIPYPLSSVVTILTLKLFLYHPLLFARVVGLNVITGACPITVIVLVAVVVFPASSVTL